MPLTLDRIGKRAIPAKDEPVRITSLEEAFDWFRPKVTFHGMLGSEPAEIAADFEFHSVKDFDPSRLQERQLRAIAGGETIYAENRLAFLHDEIKTLATLVRCWQEPSVGELWTDSEKRKDLLATLDATRQHWHAIAAGELHVRQLLPSFKSRFPAVALPIACLAEAAGGFQAASGRDEAIGILEERIQSLESLRDEALREIFDLVRPLERSYRLLHLFFENAGDAMLASSMPAELYVFNLDTTCSHDASVINALERFIAGRNDNFNSRDDVCALVFQDFLSPELRESLERLTAKYGVILISDLGDVISGEALRRELRLGGRYEFARFPETHSFQHVLVAGELRLRSAHWFEDQISATGLTAPSSLVFSAAWARDERVQRLADEPCTWRVGGGPEPTPELTESDLGHSRIERQIVATARAPDGSPMFYGCRPVADDANGILRCPIGYRVGRYMQRLIGFHVLQVAGLPSTRESTVENLEAPLQRILDELEETGTIEAYDLFVDKSSKKLARGVYEVALTIRAPGGGEVEVASTYPQTG